MLAYGRGHYSKAKKIEFWKFDWQNLKQLSIE